MKRKMKWFATGILCLLLAAAMTVTALAAGGWDIHVDPINVLIGGEVFHPRDVTGTEVPVFVYDGTTYAPLRGLAEAYGLKVDYDPATHTATVDTLAQATVIREPDSTARDFSYQWRIEETARIGGEIVCTAVYAGPLGDEGFQTWWSSFSTGELQAHTTMLAKWTGTKYPGSPVTLYFVQGGRNLGTAHADGGEASYTSA